MLAGEARPCMQVVPRNKREKKKGARQGLGWILGEAKHSLIWKR